MSEAAYLQQAYGRKIDSYFSGARADYISEMPTNPDAVILEIGCGTGSTGALALHERKCGSFIGVEMFEAAARQAAQVLTAVHIGNAEAISLPYEASTFDALICSEVLEHLVDPDALLQKLRPLMKPGARVFASSPNVAHWRIIAGLIAGRFDYEDIGPMDRTHLRWFTQNSYRAMFERAGFTVDSVQPLGDPGGWKKLLRVAGGARFAHLWGGQMDLRAHVPHTSTG